jgi:hypothetical protein
MIREPCLCVAESCNYEHGHDARPAMHHGKLAIPRCKYGFLHDPEDWICPRHRRPRRAKVLGSKANGRPLNATRNQEMIVDVMQHYELRDNTQVVDAIGERFGVAVSTKVALAVLHNMRARGWVERRTSNNGERIQLTKLGVERWASDG